MVPPLLKLDGETTSTPSNVANVIFLVACESGMKLCTHSGECIHEVRWCNAEVDCLDASDEKHCGKTSILH